jgi:hypothetical protein
MLFELFALEGLVRYQVYKIGQGAVFKIGFNSGDHLIGNPFIHNGQVDVASLLVISFCPASKQKNRGDGTVFFKDLINGMEVPLIKALFISGKN